MDWQGGDVPHFNPDAFGESLLGNGNSFAPHQSACTSLPPVYNSLEPLTVPGVHFNAGLAPEGMAAIAAFPTESSILVRHDLESCQ